VAIAERFFYLRRSWYNVCVLFVGYVCGCVPVVRDAPLVTEPETTVLGTPPPSRVMPFQPTVIRPTPLKVGHVSAASQTHASLPAPTGGEAHPASPWWVRIMLGVLVLWTGVLTGMLIVYWRTRHD
jgi:hypothetical protein